MVERSKVQGHIERAMEVYLLLSKEIEKVSKEMEELRKDPESKDTEIYLRVQKMARYTADHVAIATEIAVLNYIIGKEGVMNLPSHRYDINDDSESSNE